MVGNLHLVFVWGLDFVSVLFTIDVVATETLRRVCGELASFVSRVCLVGVRFRFPEKSHFKLKV
jgi:hypothetical protein